MPYLGTDRIGAGNRKRALRSAASGPWVGHRRFPRSACLPIVLIAAIALTANSVARAATITVDTLTDGSVATHCTLRDAITAANSMTAMNPHSDADRDRYAVENAHADLGYYTGRRLIGAPTRTL